MCVHGFIYVQIMRELVHTYVHGLMHTRLYMNESSPTCIHRLLHTYVYAG